MKRSLALLALAACSSQPSGNPPVLWLATADQDETQVKLQGTEPPPF